jgi:isoamyl acetate esterase
MASVNRPTWVLFGDSITQKAQDPHLGGWASRLQDTYQRRVDVLNRGYSGYNSRWAKMVLPYLEDTFAGAQLVTVWFGANDAALPDRTSKVQHVPVEEYTMNLKEMVERLKCLADQVVLLTPPPVSEPHRILHAKETYGIDLVLGSERTNNVTKMYAEACVDVGEMCGVPVVDMWGICMEKEPVRYGDLFLNDGLHLTEQGNGLVYESIMDVIKDRFPVDSMPVDVPEYRELIVHGDGEADAQKVLQDFLSSKG